MFKHSAALYDAIYQNKDYPLECEKIHQIIQARAGNAAKSLLDIACGTGHHMSLLSKHYQVEGLDIEESLLQEARRRHPDLKFHHADMTSFQLGQKFDVITCLFSSIGYVKTEEKLKQAMGRMASHLNPGGVLIVEPWFSPDSYFPGRVHALFIDRPELKIVRMNVSDVEDNISVLNFHYMVGTTSGIEVFQEKHELAMFTHEQYLNAFDLAGFQVEHDPKGLMDRGLYVGRLNT